VVALDPEQRPDAGEQLGAVERLRDEVIRTRLDRRRFLGALARREHDHRQDCGLLLLAQPLAHGEAVGWRHHHVEQHQVWVRRPGKIERSVTARGRDDVIAVSLEHRLEQAHVLGDVVDHQDPRVPVAHGPPPLQ
jgi:hypothetical protein